MVLSRSIKSMHIIKKLLSPLMLGTRRISSTTSDVLMDVHGQAGVITLNRPKALNALNLDMIRSMQPVLNEWEADENVRVILMKGAGEKAFCAGGDVRAIAEQGPGGDMGRVFFHEEYQLNHTLGTLTTPMVALISGITMGGGVGLSVHGRYRVASERTLFAMPETAIGLFPDVGGGHFLPRLAGKLGLYLSLTGFRLKGRDVLHSGVATHFVPHERVEALESKLVSLSDANHASVQEVLEEFHEDDADHKFSLHDQIETINRVFAHDSLEGIQSALEAEGSDWSTGTLATLSNMSPLSMKVTLRQLQEGADMSLRDVLEMEYRLSQRFMEDADFYEGIRAILVDKDGSPKWQHAKAEEVTDAEVERYFQPLPADRELVIE